jgi:hypothetical protein
MALRQEGVEPKDQLRVPIEECFYPNNHSIGINPASIFASHHNHNRLEASYFTPGKRGNCNESHRPKGLAAWHQPLALEVAHDLKELLVLLPLVLELILDVLKVDERIVRRQLLVGRHGGTSRGLLSLGRWSSTALMWRYRHRR